MVIFTFPADIAHPGREIGNRDHFTIHPGKISRIGFMHLPDIAFAARNHALWFAECSQKSALSNTIVTDLVKIISLL